MITLSCELAQVPANEVIHYLPNILCTTTGGTWVVTGELAQGECDHSKNPQNEGPIEAGSSAGDSGEGNDILDGNNEEMPGEGNVVPEEVQSEAAASQTAPEYAEPEECNAADQLFIYVSSAQVSEDNSETDCEYFINFTNRGDQEIRVYYFKHYHYMNGEDGYEWENYTSIEPGTEYIYECDREDRKSDGAFSFHYLEKIAPVLATDSCKNTFQNNTANKELIAIPLQVSCP